jgi:hypothetical protein
MRRNVMSEALQHQQQLAARSRAHVKSLSQTPNVRSLGAAHGGHRRRDAITQNAVRLIVFEAKFIAATTHGGRESARRRKCE